jgi:hypothetical protein
MPERPAPLVLLAPARDPSAAVFGSYVAIADQGRSLLVAELSQRLGRAGAAVAEMPRPPEPFHWGRWFGDAARAAVASATGSLDVIGYASPGAAALLDDSALDALLSPIAGQAVATNRFSADAFTVAGDTATLQRAIDALAGCASDNAAPRAFEASGFTVRDLGQVAWARFDVDTPLDLALLRIATRLPETRRLDQSVAGWLEMARLPGDRPLLVPHQEEIGAVMRDRGAELVIAGRIPAVTWQELETETACRVRAFVEERGMRSAAGAGRPRSVLAALLDRSSAGELVAELSRLGDAVVLDTRVLMAARTGSAEEGGWPPAEERFASDFGDAGRISTPWLRELSEAATAASVPFLFGAHTLVSDGLRIMLRAAWLGR